MDKRRSKGRKQPDLRVLPKDDPPRLIPEEQNVSANIDKSIAKQHRESAPAFTGKSIDPTAVKDVDSEPQAYDPKPLVDINEPEGAWGVETQKKAPVGWFFLGATLLLGLGVWTVVSLNQAQEAIGKTVEDKKAIEQVRAAEDEVAKTNIEAMTAAVFEFLAADSIEGMLAHVRQRERVEPLMINYYKNHDFEPKQFSSFGSMSSLVLSSRPFLLAICNLENGEKVELLLQEVEAGSYRVDWETFVHYQPMSWAEFLKKRPGESSDMRIICSADNFYAFEFRDDSKYQCYRLTARGSNEYVYGYVERSSPLRHRLNAILNQRGNFHPMILRLCFPDEGHSKRSVVIEDLLSSSWTYSSSPKKNGRAVALPFK